MQLDIRLSDDQYEAAKSAGNRCGVSISRAIRAACIMAQKYMVQSRNIPEVKGGAVPVRSAVKSWMINGLTPDQIRGCLAIKIDEMQTAEIPQKFTPPQGVEYVIED